MRRRMGIKDRNWYRRTSYTSYKRAGQRTILAMAIVSLGTSCYSPPVEESGQRRSDDPPVDLGVDVSPTEQSGQRLSAPELQELRLFALDLINKDRADHGLPALALGLNPAAQMHAEDMLEHNYLGHWWADGRKPYMVYTETGGRSYAAENAASSGWTDKQWAKERCGFVLQVSCEVSTPREAISRNQWIMMYDDAHADWGHRENILRSSHRAVNIGVAFNGKRVTFVQHFEGGAVEALEPPTLTPDGTLSFAVIKREAGIRVGQSVAVYYDPLPTPKAPAEIDRLGSYCYGGGFTTKCSEPVAHILEPPPPNHFYRNLGPHEVIATQWEETDTNFRFTARLGALVMEPGVYTVSLRRDLGSQELAALSVTQPAREFP